MIARNIVCIVIPAYNEEKVVEDSVNSIKNEVILVDAISINADSEEVKRLPMYNIERTHIL